MIGPYFDGGRVLDLYAGSGGLSIEAVSRGMSEAVLVERDRRAQEIVAANIAMTKEKERFQLLKMEAKQALGLLTGTFDLVFLDPPYAKEEIVRDIETLCERHLLSEDIMGYQNSNVTYGRGIGVLSEDIMIVCETDKHVELPEEIGQVGIWKEKIYGISKVTVYVR